MSIRGQKVKAILDTGASQNYIGNRVSLLFSENLVENDLEKLNKNIICSAFNNNCIESHDLQNFQIVFTDEHNANHILNITAIAIDSEYDIIIGREFIKQYNLVKLFATYFCSDKFLSEVIMLCQASVNENVREIPQ